MCLTFLYTNPSPSPDVNGYKLILANNRDEFLNRPTLPAAYLDHAPHVISPSDLEKDRGGTWIGASTRGKIGVLLNILLANTEFSSHAHGRGHIVHDYLVGNEDGISYMQNLTKASRTYNPFHFITIDMSKSSININQYTQQNKNGRCKTVVNLDNGFCGFCNSDGKVWKKCQVGLSRFEEVVSSNGGDALPGQLFSLLSDARPHPDAHILQQAKTWSDDDFYRAYSAINVQAYKYGYGTRTQTVILVDCEDNLVYREKYITNTDSHTGDYEWRTNEHHLKLALP